MNDVLGRIFKDADLKGIEAMVIAKRRNLGPKYDRYIFRTADVLSEKYPTAAGIEINTLREIVACVDVIGVESHSLMKRLGGACAGCGWCCSQTIGIHVPDADVERISRELKKKKEEIFTFNGEEWHIKQAQPCQWWNSKNGRCAIYNIRPRTCRSWPLAENELGVHTLVPEADCSYSVNVLIYKVLGALALAKDRSSV